ncbi:hypothetical protein BJ741DRAFT_635004 [Chytriomyces cf. hyalinus JEL632]|nr:hypothetical protein BJ741DRAFT_635004 [Chytriomyces cf. hyalinus JEL632]
MGVKSLWTIMRSMFPQTVGEDVSTVQAAANHVATASHEPASNSSNVHVLVDVNGMLHRAAYRVEDNATGTKKVLDTLAVLLDFFAKETPAAKQKPFRVVSMFVAVDGPPPFSKLTMQRARRVAESKRRSATSSSRFNPSNFTPGATFMLTLDAALTHHACCAVTRTSSIRECVYSGSRVPGEGETKIVKQLHSVASDPRHQDDIFITVTGDSDAIIHLLLTGPETRAGILNQDQKVAFSTPKMRRHLEPLFPNLGSKTAAAGLHRVQQDLALLFILSSGNDLLPSLEETSFNALWIAYQDVINSTAQTDNDSVLFLLDVPATKLNFETFARILEKAQQLVLNGIVDDRGVVSDAYLNSLAGVGVHSSHVYVSAASKTANAPPVKTSSETQNEEGQNSEVDETDVEDSEAKSEISSDEGGNSNTQNETASQYMDALMWTLLGNTRGQIRDYRHMYMHHNGPTVSVLKTWLSAQMAEGREDVFWDGTNATNVVGDALVPGLCAVSVIPAEQSQVMHKSYSKWISEFSQHLEVGKEEKISEVAKNKSELLLSNVLAFETRFKAMDARNLYQPVLKFASPCRVRFIENTNELVPGKSKMDACALPLPPFPNNRNSNTAALYFAQRGRSGLCFETLDAETGRWIWVDDVAARIMRVKSGAF